MTEIHALSGAYAVDAVDDLERSRFERHLAACAECRVEVASLRATTVVLAAGTAANPPDALRERVLSAIATVRPLPPEIPAPTHRATVPEPTAEAPAPIPTIGPAGRGRRWMPALVAAAVLAAVGIGAAVMQPWSENPVDDPAPSLTATEQVLQAPDAAEETLTFPGGASATLVRSESEGHAVIVTEAMPAAPDGKVYQLWYDVPGAGMVSAGVMPAEADQTVLLEGDAVVATAAGITVEPTGGSTVPTGDPIALFDFDELESDA